MILRSSPKHRSINFQAIIIHESNREKLTHGSFFSSSHEINGRKTNICRVCASDDKLEQSIIFRQARKCERVANVANRKCID